MGALDLDKVELEHKDGSSRDHPPGSAVPVSKLGGNVKLPGVPLLHDLHGLGPPLDDLVRREGGGGAALVGRVELLAGDEGSGVVALAGSGDEGGLSGGAALEHLVHEPRGEGGDTILSTLLGEPRLALGGGDWGGGGGEMGLI